MPWSSRRNSKAVKSFRCVKNLHIETCLFGLGLGLGRAHMLAFISLDTSVRKKSQHQHIDCHRQLHHEKSAVSILATQIEFTAYKNECDSFELCEIVTVQYEKGESAKTKLHERSTKLDIINFCSYLITLRMHFEEIHQMIFFLLFLCMCLCDLLRSGNIEIICVATLVWWKGSVILR